ncbi:MAG: methyltransferase domain-containing protein [Nitrospirae bacterium]|nr:methyltransferase domain-containing protein [Nitrospirota bacterium]
MTPDAKLIEILCCPSCRGDLRTGNSPQDLVCVSCGESFGSSDGIFEMFRSADLADPFFAGYREDYEEHAKGGPDITQWSWLEALAIFMGRCDDRLVLDIGSADGKLGAYIAGQTVCFDISLTCLKTARGKGLTAVAGKAEVLPFKRVFDIVVLSNILEHVPDPGAVIRHVEYVLKPGGRLYVVVPYKEDLSWYEHDAVLDPHLVSFDLPRIRRLLRNFRVTRQRFTLFTTSRPLYSVKSFIKDFSPRLYKRLRGVKKSIGGPACKGTFPRWRNALNYCPNALVLPLMRPYLIMLETEFRE